MAGPASASGGDGVESHPAPAGGAPRRSLIGRVLGSGAELVVAAGITFGFFTLFLVVLARVFPLGLSLETIASQLQSRRLETTDAVVGASDGDGGTLAAADIAALHVLRADVRSKPADAIAWATARDGQPLHDRDGVQTGVRGRARLQFGADNQVFLERNSLVIVSSAAAGASATPGGAVVVLEGELWGRFATGGPAAPRLKIGNATLMAARGPGPAPEFRVRVGKDHAGTVSVLSGQLELATGSGPVRVGPRQVGRIAPDGAITGIRPLPAEPELLEPADRASFRYRDLPPQIAFRWSEVPGAERYRVVVSRDRAGQEVVVDEVADVPRLTWGRLKEGRFSWRVSTLVGDVEGAPSAWRAIDVTREAEAVPLAVAALPKTVSQHRIRLTGRIGRPATVYVSGVRVATGANGTFEYELELQPGANVIVVEAVDASGNTAYWSQIVNARF